MKKPLFVLGLSVAVVSFIIVAFFAFNSYIYRQKQAPSPRQSSVPQNFEPYQGTLTGEYVCLPHVDQTGPQTLECALGMKTDTGEYYALDFNLLSQQYPDLKTGERFSATGMITPIENLSTDHWKKYPLEGILSVAEEVKKL